MYENKFNTDKREVEYKNALIYKAKEEAKAEAKAKAKAEAKEDEKA